MTTADVSLFHVSPGNGVPLYRQLAEQIRRLIAGGVLSSEDTLPSVRDLAEALAINPMTVSKAYSQLESENVLLRHRGVGMVVPARAVGQTPAERLALLRPTLEKAAHEARELEVAPDAVVRLMQTLLKAKP